MQVISFNKWNLISLIGLLYDIVLAIPAISIAFREIWNFLWYKISDIMEKDIWTFHRGHVASKRIA